MQPRKRILIVEDSEDTRFVYSAILSLDGYEVLEAPNGETGVAIAVEHRPDLIITDINMPGMNGFDVARQVRADDRIAATPIVAVTGTVFRAHESGMAKALFDSCFFKPMKPSDVLAEVKRLVG
ncbi:MAG TPA: response regulator [Longimicrobiaceae bacterium]